jgi:hypothetical protein
VNQYGAIARQHWKRWRPASYAAISDPQTYFTDLGERAADAITRLQAQMRAQEGNPPGEDYLARVARLNAIRKQAEEIVLADLILLPPNPVPAKSTGPHRHSRHAGRSWESLGRSSGPLTSGSAL